MFFSIFEKIKGYSHVEYNSYKIKKKREKYEKNIDILKLK